MSACKLRQGMAWIVALSIALLLGACASPGSSPAVKTTASPASQQASAPATKASTPSSVAPAAATPPAAAAGKTQPAAEGGEINVTLKDNTFPEEIRVKAGAKVVFVISNKGTETHSFEVPDFKFYHEIAIGKTERFEWTVPDKKGKWDVGCFLTDPPGVHERMEGTLIIE